MDGFVGKAAILTMMSDIFYVKAQSMAHEGHPLLCLPVFLLRLGHSNVEHLGTHSINRSTTIFSPPTPTSFTLNRADGPAKMGQTSSVSKGSLGKPWL